MGISLVKKQRSAKYFGIVILVLVVVILIVQNHEAMSTKVVFRINFFSHQLRSSQMSLYYVVTIAFIFGLIVSALYGIIERFRLNKTIKALKTAGD